MLIQETTRHESGPVWSHTRYAIRCEVCGTEGPEYTEVNNVSEWGAGMARAQAEREGFTWRERRKIGKGAVLVAHVCAGCRQTPLPADR